jgi:hypothetical protein
VFVYGLNNPGKHRDPPGLWIHPHQIVSPGEAVRVVQEEALPKTMAYNPASEDLLDFLGVGYVDEYVQKAKDLLEAEMAAGGGKSFLLLAYLARYNWPGGVKGRDGWHNRFVFTCKHGWIDIGHFFEGAVVGYWLEKHGESRLKDPLLAVMIEEEQFDPTYFKKYPDGRIEKIPGAKFDGSKESYMTAEDVPSNFLGMQFGRDVASGAIGDVVDAWGYFLMKSHAVDLEKDPSLRKRLQDDANVWWGNKYPLGLNPNTERQFKYEGPRESWEFLHVKCQSEEFRKMCCCWSWSNLPGGVSDSEAGHVKQCEEQVLWGNCEVRVPVFHFP